MDQADTSDAALPEKSPEQWSRSDLIAALVKRCRHAETAMMACADGMPSADEIYGDAPPKWFHALMEARVYWETYDGPSPLAFRLDDVCSVDRSDESESESPQ